MTISVPSTLSPDYWPFSLELLPQPAYLVGGAVRDAILSRTREYLDLDFVLPSNAVKTARKIASYYKAGFVLLDAKRQIARVVFPQATVDFAQQEGDSLTTDLQRRDFTVNAIAYNPYTQEIIDPLQGYADLQQRLLRMISPANLEDDPLRLMRAYRQAAQLGFTIESNTQDTIRSLAAYINTVAAERVRVELGYMLNSSQGTPWAMAAWEDGLLTQFFKHSTKDSISRLPEVDKAASQIAETWHQLGVELSQYIRDTVKTTWLGIAKLACLVKPEPETAETELMTLTYSRAEIKAVLTALKLIPQFKTPQLSVREQYFLFQEAGLAFPAIVTLAIANGTSVGETAPLITRYLNPDDLVAHPTSIVSGNDIMITLKIPASPLVGQLLTEIALAQIEGKVSTAAEAIEFAAGLISEQ
ncbi:CCA tRNA nucleotidyltransferase [Scytonema sp. UIC 10036]|uniref:CCA tRNA nucleotidyltransferase n=1 Tax=Scytonema sp. UIC 10036 TaxID=2304196 RepID=UPI0012DAD57C|nr:CCA tRNA nucleotidyltransferase [Scytonema sp. UIC 10036]MUG95179.1 CCA tRNA nucleotidyltransferase [Scytonema sp. UIC 10036]QGX02584.1 CCA tRNA nucleotidyltransferase [Scytonema sp. UIC 10036]